MPQVALIVAGSYLGAAATAGTALAFAGSAIGAWAGGMLANALFSESSSTPTIDLAAAKVAEGTSLALCEGHPVHAGWVIWASDKRYVEVDSGGKGGGGSSYKNYYEDLYLGLTLNPGHAGCTRIWVNGELAANLRADATDATIDASATSRYWDGIVFHSGADDQEPDPVYEAAHGVGNVSAHRGGLTVMIQGLNLGTSGQRPMIVFEVAGQGGDTVSVGTTRRVLKDWAKADVRGAPPEGASMGGTHVIGINGEGITTYRAGSTPVTDSIPMGVPFVTPGQGNGDIALAAWGHPFGTARVAWAGSGHSVSVELVEPHDNLGAAELRFSTFGSEIALGSTLAYEAGKDDYTGALGAQGCVYIYALDGTHRHTIPLYPAVDGMQSIALSATWLWVFDGSSVLALDRAGGPSPPAFAPPAGADHRIFVSQEGALCCANAAGEIYLRQADAWTLFADLGDARDETNTLLPAGALGTAHAHHMVRASAAYAVVTTRKSGPVVDIIPKYNWNRGDGTTLYASSELELVYNYAYWNAGFHPCTGAEIGWGSSFFFPEPSCQRRESYYHSWERISDVAWPSPEVEVAREITYRHIAFRRYYPLADWPPYGMFLAQTTQTIYRHLNAVYDEDPRYYVDVWRKRVSGVQLYEQHEPTLEEVILGQHALAEDDLSRIDASDLADIYVHALPVDMGAALPADTINMLAGYYRVTSYDAGGMLCYTPRGGAPDGTILYADMGATTGDTVANRLPVQQRAGAEVPEWLMFTHCNLDDDYQEATARSTRLHGGNGTAASSSTKMGFTRAEGEGIVAFTALDLEAGQVELGPVLLSLKHVQVLPGRPWLLQDKDGSLWRARCTRVVRQGTVLETYWAQDDASIVAATGQAVAPGGGSAFVRSLPATYMLAGDWPLLRDADDTPGYYVAHKAASLPWPGCALYTSPVAGAPYERRYEAADRATFGNCLSVLPGFAGGEVWDQASRLRVHVPGGQLASSEVL